MKPMEKGDVVSLSKSLHFKTEISPSGTEKYSFKMSSYTETVNMLITVQPTGKKTLPAVNTFNAY